MSRRPIPDFPGYEATKSGRIYSNKTNRYLKPWVNCWGYALVDLQRNRIKHHKQLHRAILETFIGPCPKGMECCHSDGNKTNNRLSNLRWDTPANNYRDTVAHGYRVPSGSESPSAKLNDFQVRVIKRLLDFTKEITQKEIGVIFNISPQTICDIKKGRRWTHTTKK